MKKFIQKELNKIKNSFSIVKKEIKELFSLIKRVEADKDIEITKLKNELYFLKKLVEKNTSKIIEEDSQKIIGNSSSLKFHYSTCPFAKNINSENIVQFKNITEAVKTGFNECSCIKEPKKQKTKN